MTKKKSASFLVRAFLIWLAAATLWSAPASAAIAPVPSQKAQSQNAGASTTQPTTLTGTAVGNFIAVAIFWCDNASCNANGGSIASVISSAGETCSQSPGSAGASSGLMTDIWYCTNIHGGSDTITVTANNGAGTVNFLAVLLSEWSGVSTTAPLDSVGNNSGSAGSSSISLPTGASTATAGELIFSMAAAFNPLTSGQTAINTAVSSAVDAFQIAGAPAVYTNTYTLTGGANVGSVAAFKPAGGGGGGAGKTGSFLSMLGFISAGGGVGTGGGGGGGGEAPGPSASLFATPYYSCVRNFYINSSTGLDSRTAAQAQVSSTPWLTIANYETKATPAAGDCVNITGTFASGNTNLTQGGNAASATGYIVYRCATLNGCTISTADQFAFANNASFPNYLIFDGFNLVNTGPTVSFRSAIQNEDSNTGTTAHSHHWWVINNIISGWGQSGVQLNDGEFFYTIHNRIFGNSNSCSGAQGSGVSYAVLKPVSAYSKTADDLSNPTMSIYGTSNPFNNIVAWNEIYNNWVGCGSSNTDGNGIIMDTFCTGNGNTVNYPNRTLIAFNVAYNNGAAGVRIFFSSGITVVNNSIFNNHIDTSSATERGEIDEGPNGGGCGSNANSYQSNVVWTIRPSSGVTANNNIYIGNYPTSIFDKNIGRWTGGGSSGSYGMFNGATWTNGLPATVGGASQDPGWVDVASSSPGTLTTKPSGSNFALGVSSVAIGRGVVQTYLSSQAVDAGACYHTLSVCP